MANALAVLVLLGLLGIIDTSYLIWKSRRKNRSPIVCPLGGKCNLVLDSKWNKLFFVRNEVLGLLFYVFIFSIAVFLLFNFGDVNRIMMVKTILMPVSGGAFLFSAFLVLVQVKFLKNYCFYCLVSSAISLLILINVLFL
ncbi:MAG: vitamin K epoxide reductase family protein [Nanoarchaeota archaeon]|nr:vitamin K epoxide reductase family protein [Nanoarchaeota archaeon]